VKVGGGSCTVGVVLEADSLTAWTLGDFEGVDRGGECEGALSTKLKSPAFEGVVVPRGSSSMEEEAGGGGDICVGSSEKGRFSGPLPFERAAAALAAMLFALAFRLATPPRAFFTGFSAEGFSFKYNSLSKYPNHQLTNVSLDNTSSFLFHSFSILDLLFRIQIFKTFLLHCNVN
jgi:hypothetical protein